MEVMPVSDVLTKEQRHLNMLCIHGKYLLERMQVPQERQSIS